MFEGGGSHHDASTCEHAILQRSNAPAAEGNDCNCSMMAPPNKRLKLAGALVLKEAVVSCPGGHGTFVHFPCAGGGGARSLSAGRLAAAVQGGCTGGISPH